MTYGSVTRGPFGEPPARERPSVSPFARKGELTVNPRATIPELPPPALCLDLHKDDRRRRYWIRPSGKSQHCEWYVQVFFGDLQHRGATVSFFEAQRAYGEFQREIAECVLDGWTAGPGQTNYFTPSTPRARPGADRRKRIPK